MKRISFLSAAFCCSLLLAACDSNSDVPDGQVSITFEFEINQTQAAAKSGQMPMLQFNAGSITVTEIVFDGENQTSRQSVSISHEQVSTIDFATGVSTPSLDEVLIPAGDYLGVNLGIELLDENSTPSVMIEGVFTNANGEAKPIRFEFNSGEVFEADANQVTLSEDRSAIAVITFDPIVWFSVISAERLDNAAMTNGVIVINEEVNEVIFDDVEERLDQATEAVFR